MVTFYRYPKEPWVHLRTTNVVESPLASLRLRTDAAKRVKRVNRGTAVTWMMLTIAEKRFQRLNAPGLLEKEKVYAGARFEDGIEAGHPRRSPPECFPHPLTGPPGLTREL